MVRGVFEALADLVLAAHLLWIAWVIFGALVTRGRPWLAGIHVLSLIYGVAIEVGPWPCPLTLLEQFLEGRAGMTPYTQSFLVHYLEALVYPDVPEVLLTWIGVAVCVFNLAIYGRRRFYGNTGH